VEYLQNNQVQRSLLQSRASWKNKRISWHQRTPKIFLQRLNLRQFKNNPSRDLIPSMKSLHQSNSPHRRNPPCHQLTNSVLLFSSNRKVLCQSNPRSLPRTWLMNNMMKTNDYSRRFLKRKKMRCLLSNSRNNITMGRTLTETLLLETDQFSLK
jgi:hypothetical protein